MTTNPKASDSLSTRYFPLFPAHLKKIFVDACLVRQGREKLGLECRRCYNLSQVAKTEQSELLMAANYCSWGSAAEMDSPEGLKIKTNPFKIHFYALMVFWTLTVSVSLWWGISKIREGTNRLADFVATAHFDKDLALRLWATSHGGVYVPIDDKTPPSPYLEHVQERDIQTPSGIQLTLMNPAYMLRQLHEDFAELYGVKGHITSLRPVRLENGPDEWETKALKAFEKNTTQVRDLMEIDGRPFLRFMRPMMTQKSCLKCHGKDYKEGDIRGGVGISLPMDHFLETEHREILALILTHSSIFLIGVMGLWMGTRWLDRRDSELWLAHKALTESEEKYRTLFDSSRDGVFITSRDGKLLDANLALLELFGFATEEIPSVDARKLYENEAERDKFQRAVEQTGSVKEHPIRVHKKNGMPMDCLLTASVRLGEDGSVLGYQGIVRDVTEQKKAQKRLLLQTQELARSNAELQDFAYAASHDLQEPLRNVISCVTLLERGYAGKLDPNADQLIAYATMSASRMKGLINDLLAYSRVGSQGRPFTPVDCEEVLALTLSNLKTSISENEAIVTHDALPTIMADGRQMEQLFQNLLSNAIKFRTDSPPRIHISAERKENEWLVSVRDNGIGIKEEYLKSIFIIFRRLHAQTDYAGTGIGLALAKKIVERHGGCIWAESVLGNGSTFFFTLPDLVD